MSSQPKVSIVTPVFNGAEWLPKCIQSVLGQTWENWEMVIVDDGSQDHSRDIALQFSQQDPRITLLTHAENVNRGVSRSRSLAIETATGDYVCMLDADDEFCPDKLRIQLCDAQEHPDSVLFHTAVTVIQGNEKTADNDGSSAVQEIEIRSAIERSFNSFASCSRQYAPQFDPGFFVSNRICNSSVMLRREPLLRFGKPFEQLFQYEDWVLWTQLAEAGPFFVNQSPTTRYRVHAQSWTTDVMQNPLKHHYSKIEFLLAALASTGSSKATAGQDLILRNLELELAELHRHYQESIPAATTGISFEIFGAPPRNRWKRKLRRRLLKWVRQLSV